MSTSIDLDSQSMILLVLIGVYVATVKQNKQWTSPFVARSIMRWRRKCKVLNIRSNALRHIQALPMYV